MSGSRQAMSEVQDKTAVREDVSASDKRAARSFVTDALMGVDTPLAQAKLGNRMLSGLWQAAMNIILEWFETDIAAMVLQDKLREIVGDGDNRDCEPVSFDDSAMEIYVGEVTEAASVILERLESALIRMNEAGIDDYFPTSVLDAVLAVLVNAWGPHHTRRALREQTGVLISGLHEPVNFMEPSHLIKARPEKKKPKKKKEPVSPQVEPVPEADPQPEVSFLPKETGPERWITAFTMTDVSPDGDAVWVVSLRSHDKGGRIDERTFGSVIKDPTGRAAAVEGLKACLIDSCHGTSKAHLTIETPSESLIRSATDGHLPDTRMSEELESWDLVESVSQNHSVHYRLRAKASDPDLSVRAELLLRELMGP